MANGDDKRSPASLRNKRAFERAQAEAQEKERRKAALGLSGPVSEPELRQLERQAQRSGGLRQRNIDEVRLDQAIAQDEAQAQQRQQVRESPLRQNSAPSLSAAPAPNAEPNPFSLSAPIGDIDQLEIDTRNRQRNTFQQGLAQGLQNLRATVPAVESIGRGLLGDEEGAVEAAERAQEATELGSRLGPQTSFQGVLDGENSFGDFLAGLAGTQAPNIASIALSGGAAGLAGRALGGAAVSSTARAVGQVAARRESIRRAQRTAIDQAKAAGETISRSQAGRLGQATTRANAAKKQLADVLARKRRFQDRGTTIGQAGGAGSSIAASVAPETTDIILDEDAGSIQQRAAAAAGGAGAAAVINTLPVMRLFKRIGLGTRTERLTRQLAERRGLLRNTAGETSKQAAFEGGTEVAEGLIIRAAHNQLNDNVRIFSDEAIAGMIEEFAAGAILGAGGGLASGASITIRQPGPTEAALEERSAERQAQSRDRAVDFLPEEEQARREQPVSQRVDQAADGFIGEVVLEQRADPPSFGEAQEVGQAFRVLLDPSADADAVVQDEAGNEISAAEAATRVLTERFGIDIEANLDVARQALARGEQFQIDRLAAALDERAAIEEIEGTVPEGQPGSEEFRLNRQALNEELEFRRERLQEILNEGVPTVEETLDPDAALRAQERRTQLQEEIEAEEAADQEGIDPRGDALEEIPSRARPVLSTEQGNTPPVALRANQGLQGSNILGRVFVSEATPQGGRPESQRGAQNVVDALNNETGSEGRFEVRPAGDVLVRELNARAGRDDSETAAASSEVQRNVIAEAKKIEEANSNITEGNTIAAARQRIFDTASEAIEDIDTQLEAGVDADTRAQLEQEKARAEADLRNIEFLGSLQFLNQFDTVVEEQLGASLTGADPLALTPDQLRSRGIVQPVPRGRPLEPFELRVRDSQGESRIVNLVSLTQETLGRLVGDGLAGRGGTREQRQRRGQQREEGSSGPSVTRENIGRAVTSGLAEILTRNNIQLDLQDGQQVDQNQDALDATLRQLGEVQGQIETLRSQDQPVPDALTQQAAELEQSLADEFQAQINAVAINPQTVAFRSRGGVETTVGGSTQDGVAAFKAEIRNATNIRPVQERVRQLKAERDAIPKGQQTERRKALTEQISAANQKIRQLRGARQETKRVKSGETRSIDSRVDQLQRRVDELRGLLGANISRKEFKTELTRALKRVVGSISLNGVRTERLAITSTADPNAAPTLPVVEGNERNIARDQAKADKAAELAKASGGQAKYIGQGSARSSTNLYRTVYGPRANPGTFNANDAVFLSVEGNRRGSVGFEPVRGEVKRAINAGVPIITDNPKNRGETSTKATQRFESLGRRVRAARKAREKMQAQAERVQAQIKKTLEPIAAQEAVGDAAPITTQIGDVDREIRSLQSSRESVELDTKLLVNLPDTTVATRRRQMKQLVDKLEEIDGALNKALMRKRSLVEELGRTQRPNTSGPAAARVRRAQERLAQLRTATKAFERRAEALARQQETARDFNTGERAAANFLRENGYEETVEGELSIWRRRRNDVPSSEPVAQPEPAPAAEPELPTITDEEFSTFRNTPIKFTQEKIAELRDNRVDAELQASPDGRFREQIPQRMAEQLVRERGFSAKQAANTVTEIFDIVDDFVGRFGLSWPNVVLSDASGGLGLYMPPSNTVFLNIKRLGKDGLTVENRQTLIHELSHALEYDALLNSSKEELSALVREYNKWRAQAKRRIDAATTDDAKVEVLEALLGEKRGQPSGVPSDLKKAETYVLSPREWFADNATRMILEGSANNVNDPLALGVLKRLADKLKEMFGIFFKRSASTPELRKFLIKMRNAANPELETEPTQPQDFRVPEKKLSEAEQRRLEELKAEEQRVMERKLEFEQLRKQIEEAGTSNTVKVLEAQIRTLQLIRQQQIAQRREAEALQRTPEQRQAEVLRGDQRDERAEEQAGDSVVDNPGAQEAQDAALPQDQRIAPPPWIKSADERRSFSPPSFAQLRNEQNRLVQDLQDAGVEGLDVKIVDWSDATEMFDSITAKRKTLENVESLSRVKDGRVEIWVNEAMFQDNPSGRRAALNNEVARAALLQRASQLTEQQAAAAVKALGFKGGKAQLMRVLGARTGGLGALQRRDRNAARRLYEALAGKVDKPGKNSFFKDVRSLARGLIKATDSTISEASLIRDIPKATGRVGNVQRFSSMWAEGKRRSRFMNTQSNANKAAKAALEGEARPANKKRKPPDPPSKPPPPQAGSGGSGSGGGRRGPPSAAPASPDDAYGAYFMLGDTFTVQGFYASRDLIISKLTDGERGTLARALQSLPVRRQMLDFLTEQGIDGRQREVFMDDPFNQMALGYQLFAAGRLQLEESPSRVMKGLNTFAHKVLGTLKTTEQATEIMAALSDARIEARQSRLQREAKEGSFLAAGEYALTSGDLTAMYDMLDSAGLFKAKRRKNMSETDVRQVLEQDPEIGRLPKLVQQRIAKDVKAGVFTEKFTSEMAQLSDFTLDPDAQFEVQKIVGNNKLQRAARAVAAAIQFLGPVGRLIGGEAMRARFTGNAAIIDFMNSIMTDVTSQGRAESMINAKQRAKSRFDSQMQNILNKLTEEQQVELMEVMQDTKARSKDPEVVAAREEMAKLTVRMRNYALRAGLKLGDRGRDYVPLVFDPEATAKKAEELIEDWMRPRFKRGWEELARERGLIKAKEKLSEADRRQMVIRTVNAIATENNGLVDSGALDATNVSETPPRVNAMNKRELAFIVDEGDATSSKLLASVRSKDLNGTYAVYISQLVKRAEYARTFGADGGKFKRQVARARELGATQDDIELMNNIAASALGRIGLEVSPFWKAVMKPIEAAFQKPLLNEQGKPFATAEAASKAKKAQKVKGRVIESPQGGGFIVDRAITNDPVRFRQAMSWIVTYQNLRILSMAAFTNAADMAGLFFRTGSPGAALKGYKAGLSDVMRSIQNRKLPPKERAAQMSELRKLGQDLGIIEFGVISDILGQAYGNNHLSGTAKRWNDKFFRFNGMEHLTRTTRLAALASGRAYLVSKARQAAQGDQGAIQELAELDVDATDLTVENGELKLLSETEVTDILDPMGLTSSDLAAETLSQQQFDALPEGREKDRQRQLRRLARDERAKRALVRMVDETVLRPNATQRATWMNNPNWQVFSHLKGFLFTYQERVLRRGYTQASQGNYAPMMQMSAYVGMIMAMDILREFVQHGPGGDERKEDWTFGDRVADGFRRAGVAGQFTFVMDMAQANEFGSSMFFEAPGPTVSQLGQLQRAFISGRANKATAIKRAIPGSQLVIDAPVNYMDFFLDSTLDLSLSDPRTVTTLSESPVASRELQREARALLFRE